jgi:hypothetical protein
MGYFIRVFGKENPNIQISDIVNALKDVNLDVVIDVESGSDRNWKIINVANKNGDDILQIEKMAIYDGDLFLEELSDFEEEIQDCQPKSAVGWITKFFSSVKVIYVLQILDLSDDTAGWNIVGEFKRLIMHATQGIIQSDYEGFSNEEGYQILWQFSSEVTGDWYMAVLDHSTKWIKFKMDLGNKEHRAAFHQGIVPEGLKVIAD